MHMHTCTYAAGSGDRMRQKRDGVGGVVGGVAVLSIFYVLIGVNWSLSADSIYLWASIFWRYSCYMSADIIKMCGNYLFFVNIYGIICSLLGDSIDMFSIYSSKMTLRDS